MHLLLLLGPEVRELGLFWNGATTPTKAPVAFCWTEGRERVTIRVLLVQQTVISKLCAPLPSPYSSTPLEKLLCHEIPDRPIILVLRAFQPMKLILRISVAIVHHKVFQTLFLWYLYNEPLIVFMHFITLIPVSLCRAFVVLIMQSPRVATSSPSSSFW